MADKLTPSQLQEVKKQLLAPLIAEKRGKNYDFLERYLNQIIGGRDFSFAIGGENLTLSPSQAWQIIAEWGADPSVNLPVGDGGNLLRSASSLRKFIQVNAGKSAEAAASYQSILKQAETPVILPQNAPGDSDKVLQKAFDLRRAQIERLQAGLIGKLTTNLMNSDVFKQGDAQTRAIMLQMIAASNNNFRSNSDYSPERLEMLLSHAAGYRQINLDIHRGYAKSAGDDFAKITQIVNQTIEEQYHGNEVDYQKDMDILQDLSSLSPSLHDVDALVAGLASGDSPADHNRLASAIRSEIVASSKFGYVDGDTIILRALSRSGMPTNNLSRLKNLSPILEEIRVKETHHYLGNTVDDRNGKANATRGIAEILGVDLAVPWLKKSDLDEATKLVTQKYGANNLVEAYGKATDFKELAQIKTLIDLTGDYTRYNQGLRGSLSLSIRDSLSKFVGGSHKTTVEIEVPGVKHRLNRFVAFIQDPLGGLTNRWTNFQTGIALNIHSWAVSITPGSWFSGLAGHIADFTEGFSKHEGSWSGATHFFFERKWGNVLDWAAKKAGYESMAGARAAFWQGTIHAIEIGGNKLAAGLGSKIATSLAGLATSAEGIGLAILGAQIIWETLKFGFDKIKRFFTDSDFRDKILSWLPITLGAGVAFLASVPALVLAGLTGLGTSLLLFLAAVLASLVNLLLLALSWAFGLIAVSVLLFYIFKPTTGLDVNSGNQTLAPGVQCVQSGGGTTGGSPAASQAVCIANYLSQCHLNPLSSSLVNGSAWKCLVTALTTSAQAVAALAASAIHNTYLQCVGFVDAVALAAYNTSIAPKNACSYVNGAPPGFTYHGGTSGMQSGDFFVIGSSDCKDASPGHIGVVLGVGGAIVNVADANYGTGSGGSRANGQFATSQITGYLRKN